MQKKQKPVWFAMSPATKALRDALKAHLSVGNDALFALAVEALTSAEGIVPPPAGSKPRCCRSAAPPPSATPLDVTPLEG